MSNVYLLEAKTDDFYDTYSFAAIAATADSATAKARDLCEAFRKEESDWLPATYITVEAEDDETLFIVMDGSKGYEKTARYVVRVTKEELI